MSHADTAAREPVATEGSLDRLLQLEATLAARHDAARAEAERIRTEARVTAAAADEAFERELAARLEAEDAAAAARRDARLAAIRDEAARRAAVLRALPAARLEALAAQALARVLAAGAGERTP
jgi:hypothetical protein